MSGFWNINFFDRKWVTYAKWQAQIANDEVADTISVRNLQVTVDAGNDAWGRKKSQPCLVTVKIHLAKPFLTAAEADSLDTSTVHYGILSKSIRSAIEAKKGSYRDTDHFLLDVRETIRGATEATELSALEVDVFYPKGSLLGDGSGVFLYQSKDARGLHYGTGLYLKNVRIPCIIGINENERQQKQPVVVNLRVDPLCLVGSSDYQQLVERRLVDYISVSTFETLEALSAQAVDQISTMFFYESFITLRVEKPMAVPFADAPVIEIRRRLGGRK